MHVLKKYILKQPQQGAGKTCAERIKPFLLLFKFCGLFVNNITAGRLKRCSWPTYGICVLWISFFVSNLCYSLTVLSILKISTIHMIKYLLRITSFIANIIAACSSQNCFSKFFDRLDSYDHKAAQLKNKRENNLWILYIAVLLIISFSVMTIIILLNVEDEETIVLILVIINNYTMIVHMIDCLEKCLLLYLIFVRFKHLNKNIASKVSWEKEPNAIKISDVKIMYLMLLDAHKDFNDIYRNPLLLSFASLMMTVLSNLKYLRTEPLLTNIVIIVPPLLQMLIMCIICHHTVEEAKNTMCVLNKNMTMLINSEETTTKISTLMYFLNNSVTFDAAGFFTIDLSLFHSIVVTITTYLIILI